MPRTVDQNPQDAEQLGQQLDFIHDDQSGERAEQQLRTLQTLPVRRRFQIEIMGLPQLGKHPCQGGFTALTWSKQRCHRGAL